MIGKLHIAKTNRFVIALVLAAVLGLGFLTVNSLDVSGQGISAEEATEFARQRAQDGAFRINAHEVSGTDVYETTWHQWLELMEDSKIIPNSGPDKEVLVVNLHGDFEVIGPPAGPPVEGPVPEEIRAQEGENSGYDNMYMVIDKHTGEVLNTGNRSAGHKLDFSKLTPR